MHVANRNCIFFASLMVHKLSYFSLDCYTRLVHTSSCTLLKGRRLFNRSNGKHFTFSSQWMHSQHSQVCQIILMERCWQMNKHPSDELINNFENICENLIFSFLLFLRKIWANCGTAAKLDHTEKDKREKGWIIKTAPQGNFLPFFLSLIERREQWKISRRRIFCSITLNNLIRSHLHGMENTPSLVNCLQQPQQALFLLRLIHFGYIINEKMLIATNWP